MRVLDVGCGAGDVSLLTAEMVGKTGSVVGVDQASVVIGTAARRAGELGISNVEFVCTTVDAMEVREPFDAALGRNFLIHQKDPAVVLRQVAEKVRGGGLIVFQEHD